MSEYRKWDESRSPQWKYLLQKESAKRRKTRKEIEHERHITKREKEEYKEVLKDKRVLSKKKNTRKFVRKDGAMREILNSNNKIDDGLKYEYRTTQQTTTPQE